MADPNHGVIEKYGSLMQMGQNAVAARNTFLVDPSGKIRKAYTNVCPKVNMHSVEVLADLNEMK